ncbi:MAG: hypothetical protein WBC97_11230 [Gemmatimonadales bacterium]
MSEATLGGYMATHGRAAAFGGSDGQAYSVGIWTDEAPDARGRFGAALVFVRWDSAGERPVGHVETEYLAWGPTAAEAEERLKVLSLFDVKQALDEAIAARPEGW